MTKRIERFSACIPKDWNNGYENVTVGCTVENQENADYRLSIFPDCPSGIKISFASCCLNFVNAAHILSKTVDDIH